MSRLVFAVALLGGLLACSAALESVEGGPAEQHSLEQPRLGLLFSASVSAACSGRCTLSASASSCGDGGGDPADAACAAPTAAVPVDLQPWNSLLLLGAGSGEHALQAEVHVECSDPACTPSPWRFVAWHGACSDGAAPSNATATLHTAPLPGLPAGRDRIFMLNSEQPAVHVTYNPASAAVAANLPACDASSAVPPPAPGETATAADEAGGALQLAELQCNGHARLLLKAALAAWALACAGVATRL